MNISELKAGNYKVFRRQNENKRKSNIYAIQYIEGLAGQTGTNIRAWDIPKVFGMGKRSIELAIDKNELNRRFFDQKTEWERGLSSEILELEKKITPILDRMSDESRRRISANLNEEMSRALRESESAWNTYQNYLLRARDRHRAIMNLEGRTNTFSAQLIEILKENFWGFHEFTSNSLTLFTKSDIVLTELNATAGINIRVNMGQFRMRLDLTNWRLSVQAHQNNIQSSGFIHPHVSTDGNICWGNAERQAADFQVKEQFSDLVRLLATLLSTYSAQSPYQALRHFAALRPEDGAVGEVPNGTQETQEQAVGDNVEDDPFNDDEDQGSHVNTDIWEDDDEDDSPF